MADDRRDEPPEYRVYRSKPRLTRRHQEADPRAGIDDLRQGIPRPDRQVHRSRRRGFRFPSLRRRGEFRLRRVLGYVVVLALLWVLASGLLFMVSAQIQRDRVDNAAESALSGSGFTLTSPNTILVLGSDKRTKGYDEPGSEGGGARSDSIMLMRVGGGRSARLSIARDLLVQIPGHGFEKITHAYAYGGAALTIRTIEANFGIEVNHLVEVDFANFPDFIDSLGGIDVKTRRICSKINGGARNGGVTLDLRAGENHLNGKKALALARTRTNTCRVGENDLDRAARQQKILAAIKSRILSPHAFIRLPWVSWQAPQAIRSDMGGAQLLGLFAAVASGGTPPTRVMGSLSASGVTVDDATRQRLVEEFLDGS